MLDRKKPIGLRVRTGRTCSFFGRFVLPRGYFRSSEGYSFGHFPAGRVLHRMPRDSKNSVVPSNESREAHMPFPSWATHGRTPLLLLCDMSKFSFAQHSAFLSLNVLASFPSNYVWCGRKKFTKSSTTSRFPLTQVDPYNRIHSSLFPSTTNEAGEPLSGIMSRFQILMFTYFCVFGTKTGCSVGFVQASPFFSDLSSATVHE